jgi:hypothetical protein
MEKFLGCLTVIGLFLVSLAISTVIIWALFNWLIPLIYTLPFVVGWKESAIIALIITLIRSIL